MNENINLCEILKDCPINTELYSPMIGDCKLSSVNSYDVVVGNPKGFLHINPDATATINGCKTAESMLLPSQTQRDWSKWQCPKPKFDPKKLKPFDKIIASVDEHGIWCCEWFSFIDSFIEENIILIKGCGAYYRNCIPYNDETKHLVGTTDEAPEFYKYWED